MSAIHLTPAQRKEKRGEAHHLDPVVLIGDQGLTDAIYRETELALKAHGLIKVRMFSDSRPDREAALAALADKLGAAPVQHIGNAGPRVVKILKFSKSGNHRAQVKKITVFGNQRVTAGGEIKRAKTRVTSVKKKAQD